MRSDEQSRAAHRRQRNLMASLGILALLLLSIASFKSYSDLRLGRSREAQLRHEIAAGDARIEVLNERVERLRTDPAALEQLAREELLMARPGEVVIVLPEGDLPALEPAARTALQGVNETVGDS